MHAASLGLTACSKVLTRPPPCRQVVYTRPERPGEGNDNNQQHHKPRTSQPCQAGNLMCLVHTLLPTSPCGTHHTSQNTRGDELQQTAPHKAKAKTTSHVLTGSRCRGEAFAQAAVPAKKQAQRKPPTLLPTAAALAPVGSVHHSKRTDQNHEPRLKGARECSQREHTPLNETSYTTSIRHKNCWRRGRCSSKSKRQYSRPSVPPSKHNFHLFLC